MLGGVAVLVVGKAAGWLGGTDRKTVVVTQPLSRAGDAAPVVVAKPLAGNGFQPAQIFRSRSAGVVTIVSYFDSGNVPDASAGQGSGFVVNAQGVILTSAHVITTAGQSQAQTRQASPAHTVYVEFSDGDRVPATVVGYDLYDDVGVIRSTRLCTRSTPSRSGTRAGSSSASRSPRSAAPSGTPIRSRSASSRRSGARSRR